MLLRAGSSPQGHRSSPSALCVSRSSFCSQSLVVLTVMQEVFTGIGDVLQWCPKRISDAEFCERMVLEPWMFSPQSHHVHLIFSGIGSYCPAVEVWVLVHHFQSRHLNENDCRATDIRLYSRRSLALIEEAIFSVAHFRVHHELCSGSTNPAVLLLHTVGQFHAPSFFVITGAVWDFLAITRDALHLLYLPSLYWTKRRSTKKYLTNVRVRVMLKGFI